MSTITRRPAAAPPSTRPRLSWRQDMVTVVLASVMEIGGILDGWAHGHLPELETVLTPWHAVLYGGYVATASWMALQLLRFRRRGLRGRACVPVGYGLGVIGAGIWAVAGGLDLGVWHQIFGIEHDLEALLSPTHLLLAFGELLMITSPLRAAWSDVTGPRAPAFRTFLPPLVSALLAVQLAGFMLQYFSAFLQDFPAADAALGIAALLTTNTLLVGTALLLLRRWQTPPGSCTVLFTGVAVMLNGIIAFEGWPTFLAALAGGATADLLIQRLAPASSRPGTHRAVAVGSSLAMWSTYMAVAVLRLGMDWSVPLWTGAITLAVGSSAALALLVAPLPVAEAGVPEPARIRP